MPLATPRAARALATLPEPRPRVATNKMEVREKATTISRETTSGLITNKTAATKVASPPTMTPRAATRSLETPRGTTRRTTRPPTAVGPAEAGHSSPPLTTVVATTNSLLSQGLPSARSCQTTTRSPSPATCPTSPTQSALTLSLTTPS